MSISHGFFTHRNCVCNDPLNWHSKVLVLSSFYRSNCLFCRPNNCVLRNGRGWHCILISRSTSTIDCRFLSNTDVPEPNAITRGTSHRERKHEPAAVVFDHLL